MADFRPVLRLGPGKGRDFVVGDIHGAFDVLLAALNAVAFDPKTDRLFSVGDIIDRGPQSAMALEFLAEPWVFTARGNHEQMLLDIYAGGSVDQAALTHNVEKNGMGWWLDTPPERQRALLQAFAKLPFVMEVATSRGSVGLLHAEVPINMDWPTFIAKVEAFDSHTLNSAIWGRSRVQQNNCRGVIGVDRIFAGHTPDFAGARRYGNCYLVDTGAAYGRMSSGPGQLSLATLTCGSQLLPAPCGIPLINLLTTPGEGLFGSYARGPAG